jgi:hypothetical protein
MNDMRKGDGYDHVGIAGDDSSTIWAPSPDRGRLTAQWLFLS